MVRYETNGTVTVIAERFEGKRLNSPNDIVVHPDGGIWFTDPPYGINGNYEGYQAAKEVKEAVYRADPKTGQVTKVTDEVVAPNGICFSPDYQRLYVADTGARETKVWDVAGTSLRQGKTVHQADGAGYGRAVQCGRDSLRRGWQRVVRCAARGVGDYAGGGTDRHDPFAGELRERLLRRSAAESVVYDGEPVSVCALRADHRRAHLLSTRGRLAVLIEHSRAQQHQQNGAVERGQPDVGLDEPIVVDDSGQRTEIDEPVELLPVFS